MLMSNSRLEVVSEGYERFKRAMEIAFFNEENENEVRAVAIILKDNCLVFLRYVTDEISREKSLMRFPFKLDMEQAIQFAWNWVRSPEAEELLPPSPDIDGSVHKGAFSVSISRTSWDTLAEIVRVAPEWALFHK